MFSHNCVVTRNYITAKNCLELYNTLPGYSRANQLTVPAMVGLPGGDVSADVVSQLRPPVLVVEHIAGDLLDDGVTGPHTTFRRHGGGHTVQRRGGAVGGACLFFVG